MSTQVNLNRIVTPGKARNRILALVAGLVALSLLLVLALYAGTPASPAGVQEQVASRTASVATNPELMVARRYAAARAKQAETAFLATNPELMVARRYYAPTSAKSEIPFLAANPELMAVRRYTPITVQPTDSAYLAANPELMVYRRYVEARKTADE